MTTPLDEPEKGSSVVTDPDKIMSGAQLRQRYKQPLDLIVRKQLARLDAHCRSFIARSPLVMLATAGSDGSCDVSPRGDGPGFVKVIDDGRLVIPDRKGNNRLDGLQNLLENGQVGLLFIVPGIDYTLRVNGAAAITVDESLLASMAIDGRLPTSALLVDIDEAFLHCSRAFKRAAIWDPRTHAARNELPTLAKALADQVRPDVAESRLIARSEQDETP